MARVNTTSVAKRRYHSPLRDAQAAATRARVLDAALDEFTARGYPGTPIVAIARAAGVSPETIYATFGSKRGIIDALLAQVESERTAGRAAELSDERGGGPRIELEVLVEVAAEFWADHGRLTGLLRRGVGDPEIGDEWLRRQHGRREVIHALVARWPPGTLRAGVDVDEAADIAWSLTSDELYEQLTVVRGWSRERYVAWAQQALRRDLLAQP